MCTLVAIVKTSGVSSELTPFPLILWKIDILENSFGFAKSVCCVQEFAMLRGSRIYSRLSGEPSA